MLRHECEYQTAWVKKKTVCPTWSNFEYIELVDERNFKINFMLIGKLKMKKLLAIILMATITMPVLAKPVKLSCTIYIDGNPVTYAVGLDAEAGTVLFEGKTFNAVGDADKRTVRDKEQYTQYYINETSFGFQTVSQYAIINEYVDRIDLSFVYKYINRVTDFENNHIGKCILFKQAI